MAASSDDWFENAPRVPIPRSLHSLQADGPFRVCINCGVDLLRPGQRYLIERIFRDQEPIVEYAMCARCVEDCHDEMSAESRQAVSDYLQTNLKYGILSQRLTMDQPETKIEEWLSQCIITGRHADSCRARQLAAWCEGEHVVACGASPLMICGEAIEAIHAVLSEQTRGWMQDFLGDRFGLPPEFCGSPHDPLPYVML